MTQIDATEVINELNLECECAREVLAAMQAQRDSARDIAARLEGENAALRVLLHVANYKRADNGVNYTDDDDWIADGGLLDFIEDGRIGPAALSLVSRLSGGEG